MLLTLIGSMAVVVVVVVVDQVKVMLHAAEAVLVKENLLEVSVAVAHSAPTQLQ